YARHATELPGLFPAIDRAKLSQAHRHIAIAALLGRENLNVHRAIHWLEQISIDLAFFHDVRKLGAGAFFTGEFFDHFAIDQRRELAFAVIRIMSARAVQVQPADVWSEDLLI